MSDNTKIHLIAPCHFGMEAVTKKEITDLGYEICQVEDGRVVFSGDRSAVCRANVFLRTAQRILWQLGEFSAQSFEELFEETEKIPWEDYIPQDGKVWVTKASSIRSRLSATVPIQSVMKKAIAARLCRVYHVTRLPETGREFPLRVSLLKDRVTVGLDTSGTGLHKRGYRPRTSKAPIEETLAAGLLMLTPWNKDRILADPFCGSGTFPIEAAMMAMDMAPGMNRDFAAEAWTSLLPKKLWYGAMDEAAERVKEDVKLSIFASDIDPAMVHAAKENAREAGVLDRITFFTADAAKVSLKGEYGFIVTNPPYGERLLEKEEALAIYQAFGRNVQTSLPTWSTFVITPLPEIEEAMGKKADKTRKIYNGMLKTAFYRFSGPKPPKEQKD